MESPTLGAVQTQGETGRFALAYGLVHDVQHLVMEHAAEVGYSYQREQIGH